MNISFCKTRCHLCNIHRLTNQTNAYYNDGRKLKKPISFIRLAKTIPFPEHTSIFFHNYTLPYFLSKVYHNLRKEKKSSLRPSRIFSVTCRNNNFLTLIDKQRHFYNIACFNRCIFHCIIGRISFYCGFCFNNFIFYLFW